MTPRVRRLPRRRRGHIGGVVQGDDRIDEEELPLADAVARGWLRRPASAPRRLRRRGQWPPAGARRVAIVGSRHPTPQQRAFAFEAAGALASAGVSIWSGGALGVDSAAHLGALEAGGHSVAVLPAGFEPATPPSNAPLFASLRAQGGLLACAPDATRPARSTFFRRNGVLVAGVDAVLIVAADARSGSLNTARQALAAEVPIGAVPWGPGAANSAGCIALLEAGSASLIGSLAGLLAWLQVDAARSGWQRYAPGQGSHEPRAAARGPAATRPPAAQAVLDELANAAGEGLHLEALCQAGRDRDTTAALLLDLLLAGDAVRDRWGRYRLAHPASRPPSI